MVGGSRRRRADSRHGSGRGNVAPLSGFCAFTPRRYARRIGWHAGDSILDLAPAGLGTAFARPSLDAFLAEGRAEWVETVERIVAAVESGAEPRWALEDVELHLPFEVADFVDFNASLEHATNMGRVFRPDGEPLLPNWRSLPVGYHGRAGTVVVSGTGIARPHGQILDGETPVYAPTRELDVELELGFVVGLPSDGPVALADFAEHVVGVVLVNDWSARDIQRFESRPLGPFLGKSFATSISAIVTPLALLEDARVEAPPQEPEPLPHLRGDRGSALEHWALDIALELELNGEVISRPNARTLYWTAPQLVAHLTSNGASLRAGDLLATGTISGPEPGSLIERGEGFLEDGDEVVLRGRAGTVELGEVRGRIVSA